MVNGETAGAAPTGTTGRTPAGDADGAGSAGASARTGSMGSMGSMGSIDDAKATEAGHGVRLSELVAIPAGDFRMGSADFYPDEGPVHAVHVEAFSIEQHPVTNRQFAAFVEATGYVTVAERALDPAEFPGADPDDLVPGALVFTPTAGPVDLQAWQQWWRWQPGANWAHPQGPGSDIDGLGEHPVVLVSYDDASAYAAWAGRRLPTEAEFEYAARGGLDGAAFAWGEVANPGGAVLANSWQGRFPYLNTGAAGWVGTSPVGTFPTNGYGLADLIGNVWEWTTDYYLDGATRAAIHAAHQHDHAEHARTGHGDAGHSDTGHDGHAHDEAEHGRLTSIDEQETAAPSDDSCCAPARGPQAIAFGARPVDPASAVPATLTTPPPPPTSPSPSGSPSPSASASPASPAPGASSCTCGPDSAGDARWAAASTAPGELQPRRVLKGGSHLCAPEYCLRYRPAARSAQSIDSATTHIGFRCAC